MPRPIALLIMLTAALASVHSLADPLLIENVTVLSAEQAQPRGNQYVLVRDGRIAAVSEQPIPLPAGARRLDGTGKFLTPGLTDAHVHVSQAIGLPFTQRSRAARAWRRNSSRSSRAAISTSA